MISRSEALKLLKTYLKDDDKLSHSIRVAEMMENMAYQFHLQSEKWYLTGLLHDIDIQLIGNDWSQHGIEAQRILAGYPFSWLENPFGKCQRV
jgi:predicted hydrolase (HD superfamily)